MEDKYDVRPIKAEDFTLFTSWWESYDHTKVPTSDLLPNGGLGGLVVEKNGEVIAANFMYLTNSKMGYLDFLISNPKYENKDKYMMIMKLQEACTKVLLQQGCRIVWGMTSYDHLADMAEKMGHTVLEDKYHVMYTHGKIYEEMTKKEDDGEV
jgi:hypothetical protein